MKEDSSIRVEVVYALPREQEVVHLTVEPSLTVGEIIQLSGLMKMYPEIDLNINKVGVYSRAIRLEDTVQDKDRIEIYRPLKADPREVRRKRIEKARERPKLG